MRDANARTLSRKLVDRLPFVCQSEGLQANVVIASDCVYVKELIAPLVRVATLCGARHRIWGVRARERDSTCACPGNPPVCSPYHPTRRWTRSYESLDRTLSCSSPTRTGHRCVHVCLREYIRCDRRISPPRSQCLSTQAKKREAIALFRKLMQERFQSCSEVTTRACAVSIATWLGAHMRATSEPNT